MKDYSKCESNEINADFIWACNMGDFSRVKYLLSSPELTRHADIHASKDASLTWACFRGHFDIVKYLLASPDLHEHAAINAIEGYGLKYAFEKSHMDIVHFLLYDMGVVPSETTYGVMNPQSAQALLQVVERRDFFVQINSALPEQALSSSNQRKI